MSPPVVRGQKMITISSTFCTVRQKITKILPKTLQDCTQQLKIHIHAKFQFWNPKNKRVMAFFSLKCPELWSTFQSFFLYRSLPHFDRLKKAITFLFIYGFWKFKKFFNQHIEVCLYNLKNHPKRHILIFHCHCYMMWRMGYWLW